MSDCKMGSWEDSTGSGGGGGTYLFISKSDHYVDGPAASKRDLFQFSHRQRLPIDQPESILVLQPSHTKERRFSRGVPCEYRCLQQPVAKTILKVSHTTESSPPPPRSSLEKGYPSYSPLFWSQANLVFLSPAYLSPHRLKSHLELRADSPPPDLQKEHCPPPPKKTHRTERARGLPKTPRSSSSNPASRTKESAAALFFPPKRDLRKAPCATRAPGIRGDRAAGAPVEAPASQLARRPHPELPAGGRLGRGGALTPSPPATQGEEEPKAPRDREGGGERDALIPASVQDAEQISLLYPPQSENSASPSKQQSSRRDPFQASLPKAGQSPGLLLRSSSAPLNWDPAPHHHPAPPPPDPSSSKEHRPARKAAPHPGQGEAGGRAAKRLTWASGGCFSPGSPLEEEEEESEERTSPIHN